MDDPDVVFYVSATGRACLGDAWPASRTRIVAEFVGSFYRPTFEWRIAAGGGGGGGQRTPNVTDVLGFLDSGAAAMHVLAASATHNEVEGSNRDGCVEGGLVAAMKAVARAAGRDIGGPLWRALNVDPNASGAVAYFSTVTDWMDEFKFSFGWFLTVFALRVKACGLRRRIGAPPEAAQAHLGFVPLADDGGEARRALAATRPSGTYLNLDALWSAAANEAMYNALRQYARLLPMLGEPWDADRAALTARALAARRAADAALSHNASPAPTRRELLTLNRGSARMRATQLAELCASTQARAHSGISRQRAAVRATVDCYAPPALTGRRRRRW